MSHIQNSCKHLHVSVKHLICENPWKLGLSWSEWQMLCACVYSTVCTAQCVCLGCVMELIERTRLQSPVYLRAEG